MAWASRLLKEFCLGVRGGSDEGPCTIVVARTRSSTRTKGKSVRRTFYQSICDSPPTDKRRVSPWYEFSHAAVHVPLSYGLVKAMVSGQSGHGIERERGSTYLNHLLQYLQGRVFGLGCLPSTIASLSGGVCPCGDCTESMVCCGSRAWTPDSKSM